MCVSVSVPICTPGWSEESCVKMPILDLNPGPHDLDSNALYVPTPLSENISFFIPINYKGFINICTKSV